MKCIMCIQYQYQGNDRPMMLQAIYRAKDAVTVWDGDALCLAHLEATQEWRKK
jgi:hypothetical protein